MELSGDASAHEKMIILRRQGQLELGREHSRKRRLGVGQAMNFGTHATATEASAICPRLFKHAATVVHPARVYEFWYFTC